MYPIELVLKVKDEDGLVYFIADNISVIDQVINKISIDLLIRILIYLSLIHI